MPWNTRANVVAYKVPPMSCELTPRLNEKKFCTSRERFDEFVANYME
jgi:hypothetical protein